MSRRLEEDREFEVERICDKRYGANGWEYYIKWKGFSSFYNTWEPLKHLTKVNFMVKDYDLKLKTGKNSKKPKLFKLERPSYGSKNTIKPGREMKDKPQIQISNTKEVVPAKTDELIYFVPSLQKTIEMNPRIVIRFSEDENDKEVKPVHPLQDKETITRVNQVQRIGDEFYAFVVEENLKEKIVKKYRKTIQELRLSHPDIIIDYFIRGFKEKKMLIDM